MYMVPSYSGEYLRPSTQRKKIILIIIIATIILITLLFSMVYEALFSVKFRKCYFDNDVNTINLNLTFFKLFMLAVSLSFIMFTLYSLANTIYSTYSEIF